MKIVKYVINPILSFLLILAILCSIAISLISKTILNKKYVLSKLDETEFYLQVSREVQSGFENYIYQSGLPEDTIKDLFTDDLLKEDINSIIEYIYDGTEIKISSEQVRENLDNKINEYISSQNIKLTTQGKENITQFEDLVVSEYSKNVNVSNTLYSTLKEYREKIDTVYKKIKNIPITITLIVVIILILINIKEFLIALNWISISVLSAGILLKIGEYVISKNIDIDNLVVLAKSLSNLIINIAKEVLVEISENGKLFIICGFTGIIASAVCRNFPRKKSKREH